MNDSALQSHSKRGFTSWTCLPSPFAWLQQQHRPSSSQPPFSLHDFVGPVVGQALGGWEKSRPQTLRNASLRTRPVLLLQPVRSELELLMPLLGLSDCCSLKASGHGQGWVGFMVCIRVWVMTHPPCHVQQQELPLNPSCLKLY